jgi:hypothetical protein
MATERNAFKEEVWREARGIHVFLLRCEGASYKECARRLRVTENTVKHMHMLATWKLCYAWKRVLQPFHIKNVPASMLV